MNWKMNKTEVAALLLLNDGSMTVGELAASLSRAMSWTSECLTHLEAMGIVERKRVGYTVFISLSKTPMGQSLATLMTEDATLNLEAALADSGLLLLPLLLSPGGSGRYLARESKLSIRTVKTHLSRWRRMGVVLLDNGTYFLNPRHERLSKFVKRFSEFKNSAELGEKHPQARIVWQWRNEFIFSTDDEVTEYRAAGVTRLDDFKYNLFHTNQYYMTGQDPISEEEALVQALMIDPNNPRMKRVIRDNANTNKQSLLLHAAKYGMKKKVDEALKHGRSKKEIRKE